MKERQVYVLEEDLSFYWKWGSTVQKMLLRRHDHQFANPRKLEIIGTASGTYQDENLILSIFRPWRVDLGGGRDWFDPPRAMKDL